MIQAMMALRHVEVPCDQRLTWIAMNLAGIVRRLATMGRRNDGKALRLTVRTMRLVRMVPGLALQARRLVGLPQD